ncbi:unnamed protein product [Clonostachys byssicola]|uniref:DUF7029 domain-containing protein n=1 Tax=Clonostachys byssicola TaxID=160290 RepID=A0A9N9Y2C6_9HYPO|nr:unnamed protein product [Clonostachys byssicola]
MRNTILWLLGASVVLADYPRMPRNVGLSGNGTAVFNASSSAVPSSLSSTKTTPSTLTPSSLTTRSTSDTAASNTAVPSHTSSEYQFPSDKLGPIATLQPSLPDYHNVYDVEHLSPHDKGTGAPLHYVQPSSENSGGIFAVAVPRWLYPSVVLDHSGLIVDVNMNHNRELVMIFANKDAFDHGEGRWVGSDIIFVSYTEDCGNYKLGERCYFHAKEVAFDLASLSARAQGEAVRIQDVVEDINLAWGNYGQSYTVAPTATSNTDAIPSPTSLSLSDQTPACVAPVDSKYKLPTVCTGPDFDSELDTGLGIFHASEVPGTSEMLLDLDANDVAVSKRAEKKGLFGNIQDAAKQKAAQLKAKFTKTAGDTKKTVFEKGKKVAEALQKGANAAKKTFETVKNIWEGKPNDFKLKKKELLLPLPKKDCEEKAKSKDPKERESIKNACKAKSESKAKGVESPWGENALLIKSIGDAPKDFNLRPEGSRRQTTVNKGKFINFYCVNCGVKGSLEMAGNVTINGLKGITDGKVEGIINLSIGLGLGIYAQHTLENTFSKDLYDIPVSPFTIGFATIGPMLSIGTEMKYSINMEGSVLARGDVKFTEARFHYDYKSGRIGSSSFKPEFVPSFAAEGSVTLAAQFGVPLGLDVGLTFFSGCTYCKGSIGIATTPSIKAAATVAVEASGNATIPISGTEKGKVVAKNLDAGLKAVNNCTGISTTISVRNEVAGKLKGFGLVKKDWKLYETPNYVLASYCIGNKTDGTSKGRIGWQGPADDKTKTRSLTGEILEGFDELETREESASGADEESYDLTEYVVEETDQLDFNKATIVDTPYRLSDEEFEGFWFSTISVNDDNDHSYVLAACNDGNVYVQKNSTVNDLPWYMTCTTLWAGLDETVLQSPGGGMLHYYNNTMSVVGVSRLRFTDEDTVPGGSVYVGLVPFYYGDEDGNNAGPSMLAAVDQDDNLFFPAICTYKDGQGAKIYLIGEDTEAGLAILESPDVKYSITNGDVDKCNLLLLSVTTPIDGAWSEYDDDVEAKYKADPLEYGFDESLFGQDNLLDLPDTLLDPDDERLADLDHVWDDEWFGENLDILEDDLDWLDDLASTEGK